MADKKVFSNSFPNEHFPQIMDVEPQDVMDKLGKAYLVDVRRPDEFSGDLGHIREAHLLTLNTLPQKIDSLPKDQPIVFICRSGGRSAQATAFALEHGYTNVFNMTGGMLLWNELGFAIER